MTINRTIHNKNYTTINNTICKDNRLSWKAKGIWLYAFHRPDDWTFFQDEMMKHATDGEDSFRSGIQELVQFGYLKRIKTRDALGKYVYEYHWFETPQAEEIKIISPEPGFPGLDNPGLDDPGLGFPPLLSTEEPNTDSNQIKKQQQQTKVSPTESVVVVSSENVVVKKILLDIGFDAKTISELEHFSQDVIRKALDAYEQAHKKKPIENKRGWLREAIVNGWEPSKAEEVKEVDPSEENKKFANELYNKYNGCVGDLKFKVRDLFVELCVNSAFDNIAFKEKDFQKKLTSIIESYTKENKQ